jgi:hypothetical protein
VLATAHLQSSWKGRLPADGSVKVVNLVRQDADTLSLPVCLSAEDRDGRRIRSERTDFGLSGTRRGVWHRWHGARSFLTPSIGRALPWPRSVSFADIIRAAT